MLGMVVNRAFQFAAALLVFVAVAMGPVLAQSASPAPGTASYRLGPGDKLKISVYGQTEINGEYLVDGTGNIAMPLIGLVRAAGLTVGEFRQDVTAKLSNGFFVNPSVSVEVENYRPFYIIGEVNKPGEYPYVNGMSMLNAVALAGGYTNRANDTTVYIRRNGQSKEADFPADETTRVEPGDIIRVPERFF